MRMGNLDRRSATSDVAHASACAVCGASDARLLSYTRLEDGARVTVCGSHKIAHRRSERLARSVDELRQIIGERRQTG